MTTALKRDALYAYAQRLMDVGIEVTAQAHVEIGAKWAREPRVIALALLCRTLGNMKGAVSLLRQRLLVEAQVLTRCCTENLICIGALSQTGDAFVDELLRADAASKKKQAGMVIETYAESEEQAETVIRLGKVVKAIEAKHPKAKPLNTKELSKKNPVGLSYVMFSVLSEQAVHVSLRSLGRHLGRDLEGGKAYLRVDIAPDPTEEQLVKLLLELLGTVLSVIVGANETVGGTKPGLELHALMEEFEAIRDA
jgi:Family of unknown function (DUF5677)